MKREVERFPELNSLYQLLLMSQKQLLRKIQDSQDTMARYLETIQDRGVRITNEDILNYHQVCTKELGVVRFIGISGIEGKSSQNIEQFYVENLFS